MQQTPIPGQTFGEHATAWNSNDTELYATRPKSIGEYSNNIETAIADIGSTPTTLIIDRPLDALTANVSGPSTLSFIWMQGNILDGSFTLTINGDLKAGYYQIFGTSLDVYFTNGKSNVDWFPATNAGVKSAIESVGSTLLPVIFSDKTYTLTSMDETFSDPVHLYGGENTIIDGATSWRFEDSLLINNIKFTNNDHGAAGAAILLTPSTGSTIDYYKFYKADFSTMFSSIRATTDLTGTCTRLEINNCAFDNITRYLCRMETMITSGDISANTIDDVGTLTTYGANCFLLGSYSIRADVTDIRLHHNYFNNISGADGVETHGAIIYGNQCSIDHNNLNNILGTGNDHEAFYMKAYNSSISHNIIRDGMNSTSDACLTFKSLTDDGYGNQMIGNIITGDYGAIRSNSGAIIKDNDINVTNDGFMKLIGGALQFKFIVTGNNIVNGAGHGMNISDCKNSIFADNSIDSVGDGMAFFALTETEPAVDSLISNNVIITAASNIEINDACDNLRILDNTLDGGGTYISSASDANGIIRGNTGYITENRGTQAAYADSVELAHGLAGQPEFVSVVGSVAGEMITVENLTNTIMEFQIRTHTGAGGTTQTIYWEAKYQP